MEYYINTKDKIINVFIPVKVKDLVNELMDLGEKFSDFTIHTVTAKTRTKNE